MFVELQFLSLPVNRNDNKMLKVMGYANGRGQRSKQYNSQWLCVLQLQNTEDKTPLITAVSSENCNVHT